MSALTAYILARPGIVYLGDTDVAAASTTIPDLSGTLAASTEKNVGVSRNGLGTVDGPIGDTRCWESHVSEYRGFQVAAAALATTQLQVATLGVFFKLTAANNGPISLGRQNGFYITTGSSKKISQNVGGGPTNPTRANKTTVTLNTWHFMAATYDGHEIQPWLDGYQDGIASKAEGPFTSWANNVIFGGDTGSFGAGHRLARPMIFSRVLTAGELATIARLGLGAPTSDHQALFDFVSDDVDPLLAGAAAGAQCMGCGGRRRVNEGGYKSAASSPAHEGHIACVGGSGSYLATPAAPLTSTPTERDLDVAHARLAHQVIAAYTTRPSTDTPWWLGASGQLLGSGIQTQHYGGVIAALGLLQRYHSMDAGSSYIERIKRIMGFLRLHQIPQGQTRAGYFSDDGTAATQWAGNFVFTLNELLPGVMAVWDIVDADTREEWLDTLRNAAAGLYVNEANFWPNANYIVNYFCIQRKMAMLDPGGPWQAQADFFLAYLFSPTGASGYVGGTLSGVGVREHVDGDPAHDALLSLSDFRAMDPMTDAIYGSEGSGAATAPGTTNITRYGFDPNYTTAMGELALSCYQVTGDADAWQMAQLAANAVRPRMNFSTGTVTINGFSVPSQYGEFRGTRHNVSEPFAGAFWHTMRRQGRTDLITAQEVADRHLFMTADAMLNTTQQNVWYRAAGSYAGELMASPYWPGWPEF